MTAFQRALGPKQEAAVLAMLTARSVEEAAKTAGVAPRTLYRWLKEKEFDAAYRDARRASFGQSVARLQQMSGAAISILGKVLIDPNTPASTKVRAVDCVLNHASKAMELEDIAVRVASLEEAAKDHKR